ncbi:hypothetical protein BT69DRAFT_868193 [Atractiella rhizophila]|nr:hypothetical protein BT69DRAFT_868193 [Atractiella rhizophila]
MWGMALTLSAVLAGYGVFTSVVRRQDQIRNHGLQTDRPYCDILVAIPATPSTHPIRHTQQVQAEEADVSAAARTYADPSKPVRCSQMQQACCSTQAESLRLGEGHLGSPAPLSPTFSRQFLLTNRL